MTYHSGQEEQKKTNILKRIPGMLFWGITGLFLGLLIIRLKERINECEFVVYRPVEESGIVREEISAASIHQGLYCYEHLTEAEKYWYEEMYFILDSMLEEGNLSLQQELAVEEEVLNKIFQCLMNDHPELFFVEGYTYTCYTYAGEIARLGFTGIYTMDAYEREERQRQIEEQAQKYLQGISAQATDYEKVKYVYETIVLETDYDKDAEDNQNIYSVFVNHKSVCQGYAKAAQYLLMRLGVDVTLVNGMVYGGENHAWNMVWIDGVSYYMDTTWGDASFRPVEEGMQAASSGPDINYDYLCVTTGQLEKTHLVDNIVPLPECTSMDANYYVMEGAYFTDYEERAVADFFERGYADGKTDVKLKCADEEVFELFKEHLIDGEEIFNYLDTGGGPVAYAVDTEQLSLTFWLVNE